MLDLSRASRLAAVPALLAALFAASLAAAAPKEPEIKPPEPLAALSAPYPEGASGEHEVLLEIVVGADGRVESTRVVEGASPFVHAVTHAATEWRFAPARRGDQPVRARIRARIHFAPPAAPSAPITRPAAPPAAAPITATAGKQAPLEVTAIGDPVAPGSTSMRNAEVRVLPGAFGDPFRAIEAMPGVTPVFSGLPYFYVRGAPPGNVGYFLDGIRVPALFHLLAGPAVVPPALIDRVELFPGGYPAQYGRFAGGIVIGETRAPSSEWRAEGTLRLVDAGALVEAPLPGGLGSALAGARYSYTAPVVSLFAPDIKLDYWDYQGRLAINLSPRQRLTLFAFGSHDYSAQLTNHIWQPIFATDFHRVDLRYDATIGEHTEVQQAVTFGVDSSRATGAFPGKGVETTLAQPVVHDTSFAARTRVVHRASDRVLVRAGADATLDSYTVDTGGALQDSLHLFTSRQDIAVGAYADAVIDAGRGVELTPGVRMDLWGSQGVTALSVDPRFAVRAKVTDRVRLVDAIGLAHQAPGFAIQVPGVAIARLAGGLQRSFQVSSGVEADLPLSFTASATLFYDAFFNLNDPFGVAASEDDPFHKASGAFLEERALGSGYGLELYVRRKLSERVGGFLAYTLSRSTRHVGTRSFAAEFDRTHVLQAAVSWNIGRGFRVGSRIAFYTGMPLVPFYPPEYIQAVGRDRQPPFFRLDARAEKRWTIGKRGWISVVAEVQNATLSKEPNGIQCYSPPGSCEITRLGPITIPSLGVEGGI
jgi:TonB family protein